MAWNYDEKAAKVFHGGHARMIDTISTSLKGQGKLGRMATSWTSILQSSLLLSLH